MQSGISVSQELHDAFNELVSSPNQRGLIATIEAESIKPIHVLPATSPEFFSDLDSLTSQLSDKQAAYVVVRRYQNAPDGYVAVTYVPDSAPVRQKMLFASTRLTLVRELGTERFRDTLFATELKELSREGWEKHDASGALKAPLTEEEETLKGVREAEAEARGGTEGRRLETGGKLGMAISDDATSALASLKEEVGGRLVQLEFVTWLTVSKRIDTKNESIELVSTSNTDASSLASEISTTEPRYSLYRYANDLQGSQQAPLLFIYTCPDGQKVRDRMMYAGFKIGFLTALKNEHGLEVVKKFEVTSSSEITVSTLEDEFKPKQEEKQGFSRPKRPGKR